MQAMCKRFNSKILRFLGYLGILIVNVSVASTQFSITNDSIDSIETAIQSQQITCEQLINAYFQRIKTYDLDTSRGGAINAFVSLNPSAMEDARALDKKFNATHQLTGKLHCIPVIVKDNIDTIDTPSTSGSLALLGSQPNKDAFLVKQLKQAGAIIIGKGSMDEFASGLSGYSSRSGRVGNAFDPTQNPGGSSSGPAAAVSANFAVVGIGSDNSGSVRIPALFNGIVGLRPSTGLISQTGIFPRGNLDGVAGPMARSVRDLSIVLSVIAKPDASDVKTLKHPVVTYEDLLTKKDLSGVHIGILRKVNGIDTFHNMSADIKNNYDQFFKKLQKLGATVENVNLEHFDMDRKNNMAGEVEEINNYLASFPSTRKNYKDICMADRSTIFTVDSCLDHIKNTASLNSKTYESVLKRFSKNRQLIENKMKEQHMDVLIFPLTTEGKATYDWNTIKTWKIPLSSNSGLPSIVINTGYSQDKTPMPIGLEMMGQYDDETTLLQIAEVVEKNSPPALRPQIEVKNPNSVLVSMDIPEVNNFLTALGMEIYTSFLRNHKPEELTPAVFNQIYKDYSQQYMKEHQN